MIKYRISKANLSLVGIGKHSKFPNFKYYTNNTTA